ncbi:MAG TPA: cell wall-binding repeat-containing protein, partial [Solirubrobacteraceae bacterium]|nr:cell wall-binding repeat-containing protein [Solirubrobacteraceae bacterium]
FHNTSVASDIEALFPDWAQVGENVGVSPSVPSVHAAFMQSPLHRANVLHPDWGWMGIGVVSGGNRLFFTENFLKLQPGARRPAPSPFRLSGADRIQTGRVIADFGFTPGSARGAVVADAYSFHDALVGTSLAASLRGPTVLSSTEQLDSAAAMALDRALGDDRAGKTVYLVGGPFAAKVRDQVANLGVRVVVIGGADPLVTAAAVARTLPERPDTAFITTATAYPDALAVSAVSAVTGWPVLYSDPGDLSDSTAAVLRELGIRRTFVVGGPMAISERVVTQLTAAGARPAARLAGPSRIETSLAIANFAEANGLMHFRAPQIATAYNYPDALAGGALAAVLRSPVILTTGDRLHPATSEWLRARRDRIDSLYILGGSVALSTAVEADIRSAVA